MPLLVIGYGNPLRGDDGLGWRVAEEWQARRPEAAVLVCQQLTPELAEPLSRATQAAFVDIAADSPPGALTITPLQPEAPTSASFTHQLTPSAVLGWMLPDSTPSDSMPRSRDQRIASPPRGVLA